MPKNYCNCPNCQTENCPAALETETVAADKSSQRSEISCTEWMDARREAIHEIDRELKKLTEVGNWHKDEKWDLREYFKMKKLTGGASIDGDSGRCAGKRNRR